MVPHDSKSDLPQVKNHQVRYKTRLSVKHIHKKLEINQTKIKGGCQSGRKVIPKDSKSDLPLYMPINNTVHRAREQKIFCKTVA